MRTIIASVLSAAVFVAFAGDVSAASKSKKQRRNYDDYSQKYPSATPRQLQNARAYDRGDYYERDSNAHPVGTRAWWDLKERENSPGRP